MSYSIAVNAATKAEAKTAVAAKFDTVIQNQACHTRDKAAVLAVANAFIDLLTDDPNKDIAITMSGSLSGQWTGTDVTTLTGASLSVNAFFTEKRRDGSI